VIADFDDFPSGATIVADVAVVGSGPAGIVLALELAAAGLDVVMLESGEKKFSSVVQAAAEAELADDDRHAPMSTAVRRQVGGATTVWGGRCVPLDPIDFEDRPFVDGRWPITYADVEPWFEKACEWFLCGRPVFDGREMPQLPPTLVPGLPDEDVRTSSFERWSLPTDFGRQYRSRLEAHSLIRLIVGATCTKFVCEPGRHKVSHLEVRSAPGRSMQVRARRYIIACGGLETTRLLLNSDGPGGVPIGNHSDHLGRWYMGHVEGSVARMKFTTPPELTSFDYEQDIDGVWVRRRISMTGEAQRRAELPNVVGWLSNPEPADPAHRSGVLSFVYLLLASPLGGLFSPPAQRKTLMGERVPGTPYGGAVNRGSVWAHLANVARDLGATARFAVSFGFGRFLARERRLPGFFIQSESNTYPVIFHGEHLPRHDSRVELTEDRDAFGMRRLRIDVRFSAADVDGVVDAHAAWDAHLRKHGCGEVEYVGDDVAGSVLRQLGAGFHQAGTTRMSEKPEDGVLTRDLAVHGFDDLYVASSAAFVTSGQANSTFNIVVLALRLAHHLAGKPSS
jgi:choline dehydrogenase-like flavoprotein